MRAMIKVNDTWRKEHPENLLKWLWHNDGLEAVVVDDATKTYYCSLPDMATKYREAWATERRVGDKRTAAMFYDLGVRLFAEGKC